MYELSAPKHAKHSKQAADPQVAAEEGQGNAITVLRHEGAPSIPGRGWVLARRAMKSGRLKALLSDPNYSMVSAVFSSLFPLDFDQVSRSRCCCVEQGPISCLMGYAQGWWEGLVVSEHWHFRV